MLNNFFQYIWKEAYKRNDENIINLLEINPLARVVDVGCGDGQKTAAFRERITCKTIFGIDGVFGRLKAAEKRGVQIKQANLEQKWLLPSNAFDAVISNQVIEHISDIDHFIGEIYRILKPGGYCIISTENLASWHNIFALILGFQDFSHHIIKKLHVSNPLSPHYGEKTVTWSSTDNSGIDDTTFPHLKILTFKSLRKVFEVYGFKFIAGKGSGYYPLFGIIGLIASIIDPYHSHFITIKMMKRSNIS